MAFQDYPDDPAKVTQIGNALYIGPDMARNDVREALQQLAADGKTLWNDMQTRGGALPSFVAVGTGVVVRTVLDKLRDTVNVADFGAVGDGVANDTVAIQDALNAAGAGGEVHFRPRTYLVNATITVPNGVSLHLDGATIKTAAGFTPTHVLTFAGSGALLGPGTLNGASMAAPTATWAGGGIPQGTGIYASGTSNAARTGIVRIDRKVRFVGFPSGAVYAKWLNALEMIGAELSGCQTATRQFRASGSYVNVPTTNTQASEIITAAGIEAYQCDSIRVSDCIIPAISKGVSLAGDNVSVTGNRYHFGTPRHAMEHLTNCKRIERSGNFYDGRADKGDGYKIAYCDSVMGGENVLVDCTYGGFFQDSNNICLGAENMTGVVASAYGFATNGGDGGRAITNCSIQLGSLTGSGAASRVIYVATDTGAVAAGYGISLILQGGTVSGFAGVINHATPGLALKLDLTWRGTVVQGTTVPMDARVRNCDIDLAFRSCTGPLVDLGNTPTVAGSSARVRIDATDCTGSFLLRYAKGAGYDAVFNKVDLSLHSAGGSLVRALSFAISGTDALSLLNLDIDAISLDPGSTAGGQAIAFDAGGKAFRARVRLNVAGLGNDTLLNVTFANAGSMTGVLEKPIAGTISGGDLTAVA